MKKLLSQIAAFAPTIASALGGPLAGNAVSFVAKALGVEPTALAVGKELTNNPDAILKMRQIDTEYESEMKQLDSDVFSIEVEDKQDARAFAAQTGLVPQLVLSILFTFGYFGVVMLLLSGKWSLPEGGDGTLLAGLIGVMTAGIVKVLDFWLGSSHGSKTK